MSSWNSTATLLFQYPVWTIDPTCSSTHRRMFSNYLVVELAVGLVRISPYQLTRMKHVCFWYAWLIISDLSITHSVLFNCCQHTTPPTGCYFLLGRVDISAALSWIQRKSRRSVDRTAGSFTERNLINQYECASADRLHTCIHTYILIDWLT